MIHFFKYVNGSWEWAGSINGLQILGQEIIDEILSDDPDLEYFAW